MMKTMNAFCKTTSTRLLALTAIALASTGAMAQSKLHFDVDYHYNLGLSERQLGTNHGRNDYEMGGHSLRLATRYDVSQKLSAGVGIGLDRFTHPDYNTLPVFATLRYKPLTKLHNAYAFTDLGYAIKTADDFAPGFTGRFGVGYSLPLGKRFGLNFQVAYGLNTFREKVSYYSTVWDEESGGYGIVQDGTFKSTFTRHNLSFGVGITF